ncbi:MAG TPA: sialidase family protein [Thermoanaerobaculia bacterium]
MKKTCLALLPLLLLAGCQTREPYVASPSRSDRVFPGRDIGMAWDAQGGLHAIHVEDAAGGARVVYRRLDKLGFKAVTVSPPGVKTNAGGETPPVLQILADGALVAAYSVPSPGQGSGRILAQRSTDGGATWSAPKPPPNGGDPGSPQQRGPRLAQAGDGSLWTVWFTGEPPGGVYAAASRDGGATFGPRQPVVTLGGDVHNAMHPEIGVLPDGRIAVLYEAFRDLGVHQVEARLRTPSGSWSGLAVVEPDAGSPRLASRGKRAVVAFTRRRGESSEILVRDWERVFPPAAARPSARTAPVPGQG